MNSAFICSWVSVDILKYMLDTFPPAILLVTLDSSMCALGPWRGMDCPAAHYIYIYICMYMYVYIYIHINIYILFCNRAHASNSVLSLTFLTAFAFAFLFSWYLCTPSPPPPLPISLLYYTSSHISPSSSYHTTLHIMSPSTPRPCHVMPTFLRLNRFLPGEAVTMCVCVWHRCSSGTHMTLHTPAHLLTHSQHYIYVYYILYLYYIYIYIIERMFGTGLPTVGCSYSCPI